MKKTCPACGQQVEVKMEDITNKCTLEWDKGRGMAMIAIKDRNITVAIVGLDGYAVLRHNEYELQKVSMSANCGWWFRVMRVA